MEKEERNYVDELYDLCSSSLEIINKWNKHLQWVGIFPVKTPLKSTLLREFYTVVLTLGGLMTTVKEKPLNHQDSSCSCSQWVQDNIPWIHQCEELVLVQINRPYTDNKEICWYKNLVARLEQWQNYFTKLNEGIQKRRKKGRKRRLPALAMCTPKHKDVKYQVDAERNLQPLRQ